MSKCSCSHERLVGVVEAVRAFREAKPRIIFDVGFFGKNDLWQYIEISDSKLCDLCSHNASIGTFRGNHLRIQFPFLMIIDENTIKANEHPNCRCVLVRITTEEP